MDRYLRTGKTHSTRCTPAPFRGRRIPPRAGCNGVVGESGEATVGVNRIIAPYKYSLPELLRHHVAGSVPSLRSAVPLQRIYL